MFNKKYTLPVLLTFLMTAGAAQGQYIIKQADTEAALYNYAKAIPLYEKAYSRKPTANAARGLADSYRKMNNYQQADAWYEKLLAMPDHTAADEVHYAQILISNGKHAAARTILDAYLLKMPGDKVAENLRQGCDSTIQWQSVSPVGGDFENLQYLNSEWSDWSTAFNSGRIVFASDRPYDSLRHNPIFNTSNIKKKYYGWTGNSYLHLYEGVAEDSNSTRLLPRTINGDYHSANASYTADGQKVYYAITDLKKKGHTFLGREGTYTLHVEIMEQAWDTARNTWKQASPFPYNGIFNYAVGDPWISPDGKTLYFVADYGEKGLGGTDIYYSRRDDNGQWLEPVNMGPEINTSGNERTPVFDKEGTFYFATDGRPGIGGLDIFKAVKQQDHWTCRNMGLPMNSAQDDLGPAPDNTTLYFSSNRPGGKGSDDIYRFTPYRVLLFNLYGTIVDRKTGKPLHDAAIKLVHKETGASANTLTAADGTYHFRLDSLSSYDLNVTKAGYDTASGLNVTTRGLTTSANLRQDASLGTPELITGTGTPDLVNTFKLQNIYFDLAKWDIKPTSLPELNRLVTILNNNRGWKVEIATHTDARSSESYNMKLSQKRAESIVSYLISKGIARERLVAKGYGESRLINRCADGVSCSEEEHQANRRTEFTILER
ncbi:OmpA family protein [Chitinophaga tropicalis]|uniref:OmpA family protein n=1 Tax=Chitinophaga tropicalis TaxID=2683588 RepID=A0A7K1U1N0_9BACT|nr:OmpA family protein [Chitinophaga tropicalis]MVT08210.1 OmpA family protein [Chitinophaga tropicalis]